MLVEELKREGFVDSFKWVSESSVPPHCRYSPQHTHQQALTLVTIQIATSKNNNKLVIHNECGFSEVEGKKSLVTP